VFVFTLEINEQTKRFILLDVVCFKMLCVE